MGRVNKVQQLRKLAAEGRVLHDRRENDSAYLYSRESYDLAHQFRLKALALLNSSTPGSVHALHAQDWPVRSQSGPDVGQLANALLSAASDLEHGYSVPLEEQLRRGVGKDLLRDARELLDAGHDRAAAVVGFIPLESRLREIAGSWGIEARTKKGAWKGLSQLNDELRATGAYKQTLFNDIETLANIRAAAAHSSEAVQTADVRRLLDDVERFLHELNRQDAPGNA
jgi:hypothetical protein